jgi:hypothetical protein
MGIDVNAIEQTVVVTAVGDEVNVNVIDQPVLVSVTDQIIEVEASGGTGPQGPAGAGVAIGGTTGQVLSKASNTNYDTVWVDAGAGTVYSVDASGSTGISVTGGPITGAGTLTITNTLPDQIVGLTGAGTAVITGTYPNFTITTNDEFDGTVTSVNLTAGTGISVSGGPIVTSGSISVTNTAPDQVVSLIGSGTTTITGTYPNFTISSADSNVGTVTSVDMTVPTGLTISGNPITSAGTLALALASGYSIPTTANQANWTTAYNDSIVSAGVTGTTTKTLTLNQQDGGTVTASWTDINTDAVTSVFGRTGAVVSAEGDYTLTQLGDVTITSPTTGQVLKYNGTTWVNNTDTDTGLTSVGLSMPSAFAVSNSPLTSNGTLAVTGAGTSAQYIRGDGSLDTFPSLTGFVPYTGATTNVNLGTHTLTANDLVINHPSGSGAAASISKGGNGEALTVVKGSGSGNAASITGGVTLLDELHLTTDLADAYIASAATWNAKQNALNGTGFVKISGTTISYDNSTYYLASNPNAYIPLTALSAGAGISYNNTTGVIASTITQYTNADARLAISESVTGLDYDNTTGVFTLTSGYVIPTTTSATNWDAAYNDKINSAAVTGTTTKTLTLNQQDGGTITASWTDDNTDAVASVFGRTGAVIATSGDYTTTLVTEGTNLYYTEGRVSANTDVAANTAARHNAVTLGTANGLSLSTQQLSLALASSSTTGALSSTDWNKFNNNIPAGTPTDGQFVFYNGSNLAYRSLVATSPLSYNNSTGTFTISQASGSVSGFLSSTDWTTFNNKQNALTNPVTGTGTTNYLPKWTSGSALGNSAIFDNSGVIGIGTVTPSGLFEVKGDGVSYFTRGTKSILLNPNQVGANTDALIEVTSGMNLILSSTILKFNANGTEGMRLTSTGLGIGTTSPNAKLNVSGISSGTSIRTDHTSDYTFIYSYINGGSGIGFDNINGDLGVYVNGAYRMRLTSSGNLGLGVVPSAWRSVLRAFEVGVGSVVGRPSVNQLFINTNAYIDSAAVDRYIQNGEAARYLQAVGTHNWYTAPSGTAGNAISFTQAMTLTAGGRLLLGTTSDDGSNRLQVSGTGTFSSSLTSSELLVNNSTPKITLTPLVYSGSYKTFLGARSSAEGVLQLGNNGNNYIVAGNTATGGALYFYVNATSDFIASTNGTLALTIASTGAATFSSNVTATNLLTTSMSGSAINIRGDESLNSNFGITWTTPTYTGGLAAIRVARRGASDASDMMFFTAPNGDIPTERLRITSGGDMGLGTSSPAAKLDIIGSLRSEITSDGNFVTLQATGQRVHYIKRSGQILQFTSDGANPYNVQFDSSNKSVYIATGNLGVGTTSPTALADIEASTTTRASLRIRSGTAPTSPNDGDIWYDGTNLKMRVGGTTKTFTLT